MAYISFQPSDYFNTKLYTGNGSTQSISSVGFQPDWVWVKDRDSGSNSHVITDAIRGTNKIIFSDSNGVELTDATRVTSFDSDGFTVGTDGSTNTNTNDYVSWNWKANGAGSSNTDGDITSTVSANTTSGFSISTYTGTGSNATVGHGLGRSPSVVMVKRLNVNSDWRIYFSALVPTMGNAQQLFLNRYAPADNDSQIWNNTAPTNSVFHVGTNAGSNASGGTYVAYCFADIKGYQKSSSFVGTGNTNGAFCYTGFLPKFVLYKKTTGSNSNWQLWDSVRDPHNEAIRALHPDASNTASTDEGIDILSNGFKIRGDQPHTNESGVTFVYLAIADVPLVSSNGVPATAR